MGGRKKLILAVEMMEDAVKSFGGEARFQFQQSCIRELESRIPSIIDVSLDGGNTR